MEILGYSSPLSVRPGERVDFMVSTEQAEYRADIVRLIHGDENPIGPGFVEEVLSTEASGTYPGKVQQIPVGSAAIVADHMLLRPSSVGLAAHVLPTTPSKGRQGILTKWSDVDRIGYGLYLDDEGRVEFIVRVADAVATVTTHSPLTSHRWYGVAGGFDVETGRATVVGIARQVGGVEARRIEVCRVGGCRSHRAQQWAVRHGRRMGRLGRRAGNIAIIFKREDLGAACLVGGRDYRRPGPGAGRRRAGELARGVLGPG